MNLTKRNIGVNQSYGETGYINLSNIKQNTYIMVYSLTHSNEWHNNWLM